VHSYKRFWLQFFSYPSKLERIPNEARIDVITIKQTKLQLDMGSFVTLKQPFFYKANSSRVTLLLFFNSFFFFLGRRRPHHRSQTERTDGRCVAAAHAA
jgi:hypothetical protein